MSNEKMREEFEAWFCSTMPYKIAKKAGLPLWMMGITSLRTFRLAGLRWNASRAALCVELPKQWFDDGLDCYLMEAHQVGNALDAAGGATNDPNSHPPKPAAVTRRHKENKRSAKTLDAHWKQ